MPIMVNPPVVKPVRNNTETALIFETSLGRLWFSVPSAYRDFLSSGLDAALAALLFPAMRTGEDIVLSGDVDSLFYYHACGPLQALLRCSHPDLKPINVFAKRVGDRRPPRAKGVMTGFSRGVDSFSMIARHYHSRLVSDLELTHLCLNDIWAEDNDLDSANPYVQRRFECTRAAAEEVGLPLLLINSNVGAFYRGIRFEDTHTIRNTAAAMALNNGVSTYLYASGYPIRYQTPMPTGDMARLDLIVLPLLSGTAFRATSGDAETPRIEKTRRLLDYDVAQRHLQVCSNGVESNCSRCTKCMRTQLALDMLRGLDRFAVFDQQEYRQAKGEWLVQAEKRRGNDAFVDEIFDFAQRNGIDLARAAKPADAGDEPHVTAA
ncbi:hypothetical protein [uncultured Alsobacter sp.]|uniref:hypothetical protein n=1 Tax=uncultured Alsobacter sp. TaxID=1748258 RepID=UPI0025F9E94E|nr:hypothetical protein [uncultured Alsobacter sp.]